MNKILFLILMFSINSLLAQDWQYNFDKAKAVAAKENKNIVLVFSGSDWCAPCIKLERNIWSTKEYQKLAKDNFVMVKADFPRRKKNQLSKEQQEQNNTLAEKYNSKGAFPLVVLIDKNGNVLGKTGYKKATPVKYFNHIKALAINDK